MTTPKRNYDSTVARMAGNIAAGLVAEAMDGGEAQVVHASVRLARAIIAEVKRTEPAKAEAEGPA